MSRIYSHTMLGALLTTGLLVAGCETMDMDQTTATPLPTPAPVVEVQPAPEPAQPVMIQTTAASPAVTRTGPAAGAVDDSLQACLSRIPSDSTSSQRMLAERTCQRDENDRSPSRETAR